MVGRLLQLKLSLRQLYRIAVTLVVWQLLLLSGGSLYQTWASARDQQLYPSPGKLINVSGYQLHLYCVGELTEGNPTIVFEGGLGATSLMWTLVQSAITFPYRACSYDRAGYGWSDVSPYPRTAQNIANELHLLLQTSGEVPPYLIVAHSFGSLIARVYAASFPDEVAGLILIDPRHEDFFERMPAEYLRIDERNWRNAQRLKLVTPLGVTRLAGQAGWLDTFENYLAPLPPRVEEAAWARMIYQPQHWDTTVAERENSEVSYAQARATTLPLALPLTVLTAEHGWEAWRLPGSDLDENLIATWMTLQEEQVHLSDQGQWLVVEHSGHYMYFDQPAAILAAIAAMLEK